MAYPPDAASSAAGFNHMRWAAGAASAAAGAASSAASAAAAAAAAAPSIFRKAIEAFRHATGWITTAGTKVAAWLDIPQITFRDYKLQLERSRHHIARIVFIVNNNDKYAHLRPLVQEMASLSKETRRAMIHMLIFMDYYETIYKNLDNVQKKQQVQLTLDAILIFLHLARETKKVKFNLINGVAAMGNILTPENYNSSTGNELGQKIPFPPHLVEKINAFLEKHDENLGIGEGQYPINIRCMGGAAAAGAAAAGAAAAGAAAVSTLPCLLEGTEEKTKQLYEKALERIRASFPQSESITSSELFKRIYGTAIDNKGSPGAGAGMLVNSSAPAAAAAGAAGAGAASAAGAGMSVSGTAQKNITHYFPTSPPTSSVGVGSKRGRPAPIAAPIAASNEDSNAETYEAPNEKRPRREKGQTGGFRRTRKHKRNHRSRPRTHKRRVTKSKHKSNRKTKTNRRH